MNFIKRFKSKKLWLQSGIIATTICLLLFLFYIFVYFPIIQNIYAENIVKYGNTPSWTISIPLITGHLFPLLSSFIIDYGFLCKFTEPICTHWSVAYEPGSIPWIIDNQSGYCIEQTMTPTTTCANISENVGFYGLALVLIIIYFIIGAIIGWQIEKRKRKKV